MINIVLGAIQLLSIMFISIYELRRKSLSVFLWGTLLILFGLPHFISILTRTNLYSDMVTIKASFFVILFNLIYMTIKILLYKTLNLRVKFDWKNTNKNIQEKNIKKEKIFFGVLLFALMSLIAYTLKYLGSLRGASWGAFITLNKELGVRSLFRYADYLLFAASGIALVYLKKNEKKKFLSSILIIFSYLLLTGNRIIVIPILATIIINYLFFKNEKISMKVIVSMGLMSILIIYLVYFLRQLRIYGGFYKMINSISFIDLSRETVNMILNGDGELSLRNAFYHFINHNNNFENFNKGHTYIRLIFIAIPTSILKGIKPPDFAISMGSAWSMDPSNTSYSMHPTLYGDLFANLWWFGILLGIFWAIITYLIDRYIEKKDTPIRLILMVLYSTVYVIIGRGSVYNAFFLAFLGTLIILIVDLSTKFKL